jgi:hypothetical protein
VTLAIVATAIAWFAVLVGLFLGVLHGLRRHRPMLLLWLHPMAATSALVCVWIAVVRLPGPPDMAFNSGAMVLTLAFAVGAFLFALRRIPVPLPIIAIALHAAAAIGGCALLTRGLA